MADSGPTLITYALLLASLTLATPVSAGHDGSGCDPHWRPHCVVHGKPRSVFVDPVGARYPQIERRTIRSGYQPLPDQTPRAAVDRSTIAPTTVDPIDRPAKPLLPGARRRLDR